MTDCAHDVGLIALIIDGVAHGFSINCQTFVLIAAPEVFRGLENYRMLAFGGIMTTMMIIKPEGLIPASRRRRELHEGEALKPKD
jgi:branched-chain amino acid transport system permease protein